VGILLMTLNICGVAGFLSNAYTKAQISARAIAHTEAQTAHAEAGPIERQLAAAESNLAAARAALIRARDDRGRQRAAQQIVDRSIAERSPSTD
jgi:hypothetical protein